MNTIRFNGFNQIHKGLRALLFDTALQLQHTDFSDPAAAEQSFSRVEQTLWLFDGHADTEDHFFFARVKEHAPAFIAAMEDEHVIDHNLGESLRKGMQAYRSATSEQERIQCGYEVMLSFFAFTAFNLTHMNKEETEVNAIIWKHYSDDDIHAMIATALQHIPPHKNEVYSRWMMRGLGNHEISSWLKQVAAVAPEEVYAGLLQLAKEEVPPARWPLIQQELHLQEAETV